MAICPACQSAIPLADVNVATDRAVCRACQREFSYSDITTAISADGFNPADCPKWLTITPDPFGQGVLLRYQKISLMVIFLIPFTAFWSGLSMTMLYIQPMYQYVA